MTALRLPELQERLRALITDPATLDGPRDALDEKVAALPIRGDARLSAAERVRIYAAMYVARLRDALADDFPALHRLLGEDAFDVLARAYVAAHPSDRPSLRDLGRHLPGFLRGDGRCQATWHAELAQLEWAMVQAFDVRDQLVLDRSHLATLPPEAWPELRIVPVDSLQLLALTHPVDTARERLLAEEQAGEIPAAVTLLRVWRQDLVVYVRRVPEQEMAALRWLYLGSTFADLCGWLDALTPVESAATRDAASLLLRWVEDGLLVAA